MIQTIRKAWGIPELRKKIVFTLLILLIFRLGNAIMVPYINRDALALQMQVWGTGLLGLYNVMSGGAFATATVFALSIQPYIWSGWPVTAARKVRRRSSPSPATLPWRSPFSRPLVITS